ncbi:MAG TPA: DUF72 domain-containing protein [Frankiaceae bacterium]|jgi:uncharacterized protein YecE (DUF72 family)|nr:DUF72 domain-containing protein [Frankiaceae bacterium]
MGRILVGTASWTDKSLLASGWYPPEANTPDERLRFYASRFPLVEVDATYYAPPAEETARLWAERTPEEFTFNVKAFSLLTQHPTKPGALYKDLRPDTKKNVYLKDFDDDVVDQVWERFLSALNPLADAGKLGALLFQFPQWFPIGKKNKQYVLDCKARCEPVPICVEFRSASWMTPENQKETLDFLSSYGIPYVCVDMPQGFRSSIPPVVAATTSDLAVVRFHGHNDAEWESGSVQRRFAYLYSEQELRQWAPRLEELAGQAQETHVLMNNCHRDYAQRNAAQLMAMVTS